MNVQKFLPTFFLNSARIKIKTVRKAADARRDNWLYENILEYKWAVDFAGSYNFKIRNSPLFEKIEKKGTFWVKSKDEGGNIISLEELAKHVSREYSMDELDVEQKLFDFYKDSVRFPLFLECGLRGKNKRFLKNGSN